MKFLKLLGRLFSKDEDVVSEKIARVATDPRVSEPVFMMIRSMKKRPQDWRVQFETQRTYAEVQRARHGIYVGNSVKVHITDRGVGECYEATLFVDSCTIQDLMHAQALKRLLDTPSIEMMCCATVSGMPSWLNPRELTELHFALTKLMTARVERVRARTNRENNRSQEIQKAKQLRNQAAERQRLINLYGAHQ